MSYRVLLPSNIAAIIFLEFGKLGSNLSYFYIDVMPVHFQWNFDFFKPYFLRFIGLSIYRKRWVDWCQNTAYQPPTYLAQGAGSNTAFHSDKHKG